MTRALAAALVLIASAAGAETISGTIVDRASKQPVGGATITVGSELAASADDGTFAVTLPPGAYTVSVTADWLAPATRKVTLVRGKDVVLVIEVDPAHAPAGEQIEVHGIAPTAVGEIKVDAHLARSLPGGGDAAKIVQSLPSVARPAAGSTDIVIWGAAPNESRVFVDGVPVPALYHVGGYRSAVGNDLIGDIHLTPAAFGVDRGGAIGGVIDIGMADPASVPAWRAQADVLDGSALGRAKLGDATIAAAIRQSWLDQAIGVVEDPQKLAPNAPLPRWTDGQVVLRMPLAEKTVLSAWVIGSIDHLDRTLASDDPATQTSEVTDQRMVRGQLTVRRDREDGYDSATLWFGRDTTSDDLRVGLVPANLATAAWVGGARGVQQQRLPGGEVLTFGVDLDSQLADLSRSGSLTVPAREGDIHIFGQPPGDDVASDSWRATTIDAAGHGAIDAHAGPLTATAGLRFDTWLLTASRLLPRVGATPDIGSQQILYTADPRGTLQWKLDDDLTLRGDAGRYHQAREATDTSAVFGTPGLGVEEAWHVIAGGQWRLSPLAIEAAGYARWLDDLVARDLAVTPPLARSLTQEGIGTVFGVQVTARVIGWHGVSGWLSYNLSRSRRKDAPAQDWRFFDHDQTNGLIAVAGWEHGAWTLGTRVRYATGEPRTPVIGAFYDSRSGRFEPIVGVQNSVRLPAFFAADLRAERRFPIASAHGAVYLEIQNLTDRANAEEIIYSADFSQHGYLTSLPLLAIAGVRIEE
ncbi:MAG TPA: TonB-dependent receptor [Kofleriaceae bacterium]|nr:TonB-dependent receptor [Kofleriaceae bacterium]